MSQKHTPNSDASALKSSGGFARLFNALRYSLQGFNAALTHEAAFRQELLLVVPTLSALWFAQLPRVENVIIIALAVALLVVELINSAIEALTDRISLEMHPLAGRAKDIASAAVLLALLLYCGVWLLWAAPALWARLL
jgi:diacylglycerol kinase (ATP)